MNISKSPRLLLALLAALLMAFVVVGCGDDEEPAPAPSTDSGETTPAPDGGETASDMPGEGKPAVTIGTKDFTEEFILGELYTQALEAKGYKVNLKKNIGATEIIDKSLTSGEIDAYPEYTGVSLSVVAGNDKLTKSPEETASLVKDFYEKRGQSVSEATPFQDTDAIAVTSDFAEENDLSSVADLADVDSFTIGARPEFKTRFNGLRGMEEVYGVKGAEFKQLALGLQYPSLDKGDVDAANVFSTDAQLSTGKYKILEDPEGVFGFQNVYFVIDSAKLEELGGDEFMGVINSVNALLEDDAMQAMNAAVALDKKPEAEVAGQFLEANGLAG